MSKSRIEISPGFVFYRQGNVQHQMVNTVSKKFVGVVSKVSLNE